MNLVKSNDLGSEDLFANFLPRTRTNVQERRTIKYLLTDFFEKSTGF